MTAGRERVGQGHAERHDATPSTAPQERDLLQGVRNPSDLAALLQAHAGQRDAILRMAHQRFGNGFVVEAQAYAASPDTTAMRGQVLADETVSAGAAVLSYNEHAVLPFTQTGWNATAILSALGQNDGSVQTDSDAHRCVQSVGIASHVVRGPAALLSYLDHALTDRAHGSAHPTARQQSARAVLARVCDRVRARTATFLDLSWAQEALHDLIARDSVGTSSDSTLGEIAPAATSTTRTLGTWCSTPAAVVAAAQGLHDGEQLVATKWTIMWNNAFTMAQLAGSPISTVQAGHTGQRLHAVGQQHIGRGEKPDPAGALNGREDIAGHQLLITRTGGELQIYDPLGQGGRYHTLTVATLARVFQDNAADQTFDYMKIDARITPR